MQRRSDANVPTGAFRSTEPRKRVPDPALLPGKRRYRIRKEEVDGAYWSERFGWRSKRNATIFNQQDRQHIILPPAGYWEQVSIEDTDKVRRWLQKLATTYGIEIEIKDALCSQSVAEGPATPMSPTKLPKEADGKEDLEERRKITA